MTARVAPLAGATKSGSPAFFLYKNGVCVQKFSGAKEEQLVEAIEAHIGAAAPAQRSVPESVAA